SQPRGDRSARGAGRIRAGSRPADPGPRLGFHCRASLSGRSHAPAGYGRLERGPLGRADYARFDDRDGSREGAGGGMNGPHDLGGQMGFGPVAPETDEPFFHAEWEKRALGVTLCAGAMGHWNIDESRHARESLHPAVYYGSSYYEIWT